MHDGRRGREAGRVTLQFSGSDVRAVEHLDGDRTIRAAIVGEEQ
ncbi:hypothetical protein OV079_24505 [Nannocystis pusilla]|uniref:Uncharacterized protein n=1 Tax=Nannocystis pusilla TaxID=889268 RepID=A0A9X3IYN1_9BACT|nr:hypothetical protein [Nannocystis pusilla]MCY1008666.1 hypothetical protein [Nannocystis pusilla]